MGGQVELGKPGVCEDMDSQPGLENGRLARPRSGVWGGAV